MSHVPHELAEEFPEKADVIHELKLKDKHFSKLVDDYHELNRAVHRAESNIEPTDEFHEAEMRKKRMSLKDEIYRMLSNA